MHESDCPETPSGNCVLGPSIVASVLVEVTCRARDEVLGVGLGVHGAMVAYREWVPQGMVLKLQRPKVSRRYLS